MRLSVSAIQTHRECPARWRYRWKDKIEVAESTKPLHQRVGIAVHAGLETAYRSAQSAAHNGPLHTPDLIEAALGAIEAKCDELEITGEPERIDIAAQVIDYLIEEEHFSHEDLLTVEDFAHLVLQRQADNPEGHWLQVIAFMDRVERGRDSTVYITDYKTGARREGFDPGEDLQAKIYMIVAAHRYRWAQRFAFTWAFTKDRDNLTYGRTRADVDVLAAELLPQLRQQAQAMRTGPWPHTDGPHCKGCPFMSHCPAHGNDPLTFV